MDVTAEVVGGETRDLSLPAGATYADVLDAVGLGPNQASVLVDGSPVPADGRVAAERVTVLRLVTGG